MIVKNVCLTFFYLFWFYLLVYIFFQELHDHHQLKKINRVKKVIKKQFQSPDEFLMNNRKLLKSSKNHLVLDYMKDCYLAYYDIYSDKQKVYVKTLITKAVEQQIHLLKKRDQLQVVFLLHLIDQCALSSKDITCFLMDCSYQSEIQKYWLKKTNRLVVDDYE